MQTDLAVIGAGPGGYTAAFSAADKGLKVTLIDESAVLGGVCLNRGCIPSKFLLHLARLMGEVEEAKKMGLDFGKTQIDLEKIRQSKEKIVENLNKGLAGLAKSRNVDFWPGRARFLSPQKLAVENGEGRRELEFKWALVATGSRPFLPPPFDRSSKKIMTSDEALDLREVPKDLLLVGGGVIGLELGSVYSALGSQVTLVEILPHLGMGADRDLMRPLERRLKKRFTAIHTSTRVLELKEDKKGLQATFQKGEETSTHSFSSALIATGRKPNTEDLALERIGLKPDSRGFLPVHSNFQTDIPSVFALGDVVAGPMLAHKASGQARVAISALLDPKTLWDHRALPGVIYTDPEVAWVGLTEEKAKTEKIPYSLGKFPWTASGRAMTLGRTEGLTKILFEPETRRILGVGMVGVGAGELIGQACLALEMGAVVEDITGTIQAHPTLSETFLESAEDVFGLATHIFRRKSK